MTAAIYNFEINQGTTFKKNIFWKNADTNEAMNLTGYTARMQARRSYTDDTVLFDLTSTNGLIQLTPTLGKIVITIPATQTSTFTDWTRAKYSLRVTSPDGTVTRLLEGDITLAKDIIRD